MILFVLMVQSAVLLADNIIQIENRKKGDADWVLVNRAPALGFR